MNHWDLPPQVFVRNKIKFDQSLKPGTLFTCVLTSNSKLLEILKREFEQQCLVVLFCRINIQIHVKWYMRWPSWSLLIHKRKNGCVYMLSYNCPYKIGRSVSVALRISYQSMYSCVLPIVWQSMCEIFHVKTPKIGDFTWNISHRMLSMLCM